MIGLNQVGVVQPYRSVKIPHGQCWFRPCAYYDLILRCSIRAISLRERGRVGVAKITLVPGTIRESPYLMQLQRESYRHQFEKGNSTV